MEREETEDNEVGRQVLSRISNSKRIRTVSDMAKDLWSIGAVDDAFQVGGGNIRRRNEFRKHDQRHITVGKRRTQVIMGLFIILVGRVSSYHPLHLAKAERCILLRDIEPTIRRQAAQEGGRERNGNGIDATSGHKPIHFC